MQVLNANSQVTSLQVSTDGGKTYASTVRQDYDYFQRSDGSGFNSNSVTVKVTCASGKSVVIPNVGTTPGASYGASSNC